MIVYQHIRLDTNLPFYVGIGASKKRAFRTDGRNDIWNKIVQNVDYRVEILFENLSKHDACKKEVELIKQYGRICNNSGILSNITMGGELLLGEENPKFDRGNKIEINDVVYNSINGASRKLKLHPKTITYRLKHESFPTYRKLYGNSIDPKYCDDEINHIIYNRNRGINNGMYGKKRTTTQKLLWNVKKKNRYEVIVNNVRYMNIKHAEFFTGIHYKKIYRSIHQNFKYNEFTATLCDDLLYDINLIMQYIQSTPTNELTLYPNPNVIFKYKSQ